MLTKYETSVVQKILLSKCKQQTQFITKFVILFQSIISKSMDNLVFKQRSILIKFCFKYHYLSNLFNHHLLHQTLPQYIKIYQLLINLADQVQFYISQQLSKLIKYKNIQNQNQKDPKIIALNEIKICYTYLNKLPDYYKNIQQNLIGRELQLAEKNLKDNKLNLIGGKNLQLVQQFFKAIFNSIKQFPKTYPRKRLLQLIFNQLKKPQVKILYTYTLPIFPISYNFYMKFINSLDQSENELITALKQNHNWDLKRWVDVRQKNILDRCTKQWEKQKQKLQETLANKQVNKQNPKCPDLHKWIDIIFKQNCKIDGVKNHIAMLAIKVVTKYSQFIEQYDRFQPQWLNKLIQIQQSIQHLILQKLFFFFDTKQAAQSQLTNVIKKISQSCRQTLNKSINKLVQKNTKLISRSCNGTLQPYKSFIMKIIKSSKELTQHGTINISSNIYKPLTSYLQNNLILSEQSKNWIKSTVIKQVMIFYDQSYVPQVYQYAKTNLKVQQLEDVMEIIGKQRTILFAQISQKD